MGDLNYDGQINIVDAIIMVNIILNEQFDVLADLNEDEVIDVIDIILLVNMILY